MHKTTCKSLGVLLCLTATGTLSAAAETNAKNIGYNPPSRPFAQEGANLWVRGDALYWKAEEDNLVYAYTIQDGVNNLNRTIKTIDFDWAWGFRVGAGYAIPRDHWDLAFYWTQQESTPHSHAHGTIQPAWWLAQFALDLGAIDAARGKWSPKLNQLDLSLGREYYVGEWLTLRPNVGVRSTWLEQDMHIHYDAANGPTHVHLENDFWGFGFLGGLDTKWLMTNSWHFFANGAYSIVYGNFDINFTGDQNGIRQISVTNDFHAGRAILDLQAGFEWAHAFFSKRIAFTFRAGYEYHLYAAQNQLPLPTGNDTFSNSFTSLDGDLAYQGLFLSGQFDF